MVAPNVELRKNDSSERQNENVTMNVKQKRNMVAPNVELKTNDGSERQIEDATLNAKMKMQL